jgi:tRNA(Ile2) C34 agmatinyltransferase TiaS
MSRGLVADSRDLLARLNTERGANGYRCAWCGRVSLDQEEWWVVDELPPNLHGLGRVAARHSVCPECIANLEAAGHDGLPPNV